MLQVIILALNKTSTYYSFTLFQFEAINVSLHYYLQYVCRCPFKNELFRPLCIYTQAHTCISTLV